MSKVSSVLLAGVFVSGLALAQGYQAPNAGSPVGGTQDSHPSHPAAPETQSHAQPGYGTTDNYPHHPAVEQDAQAKPCPPGLAKKDNGCLPPGHAAARGTHEMGNTTAGRDRDQDRDRDHDRSGSNSGRH